MKKDKNRFTLRFCDVSPKHLEATEILNAAGRKKASLIADLIDEHIKRYGDDAFASYFRGGDIEEVQAKAEVQSCKDTRPSDAGQSNTSDISDISNALDTLDKSIVITKALSDALVKQTSSDDAQNPFLDGLGMFK